MEFELNMPGLICRDAPAQDGGITKHADFARLFETHKDRVFSIALRFSGDHSAALDIAQETFLKLYSSLDQFRGEASFDSWLFRIVVNRCMDFQRRKRRWLPFLDEFIEAADFGRADFGRAIDKIEALRRSPSQPAALDDLLRAEAQGQVQQAVAHLPADLRIVIVLRYTEGLAYEEIAGILACPPGTVASRLNRAHRILERRLAHLNARGEGTGKIRRTRHA